MVLCHWTGSVILDSDSKAGTGIVSVQNLMRMIFSSSSAPGIRTGDKVKYKASGTAISGLVNNTEYFAVYNSNSANTLKLASTKENAEAGTNFSIARLPIHTGTHKELELLFLDEQLINDGIKRFTVEQLNVVLGGQTVTPNFTCTSETFGGGADIDVSNVEYDSQGYVHQQSSNPCEFSYFYKTNSYSENR